MASYQVIDSPMDSLRLFLQLNIHYISNRLQVLALQLSCRRVACNLLIEPSVEL